MGNFLGIGPLEILVVLIVAVIVLGPERMPEVGIQIARVIKYLRGFATSATSQMRTELDELTREYESVRKELQEFRQTMRRDASAMTEQVTRVLEESQPIVEPSGDLPPEPSKPADKAS